VLVDDRSRVIIEQVMASGVDYSATASACLAQALAEIDADGEQIQRTFSTGYGRHNVTFAERSLTEIQCHGVGCYYHLQRAMTIVDIGGQDNKIIRLDQNGKRIDFKMNRKCAAGTGAFIEEIALRLSLNREELDNLAASTDQVVRLSSFCTVFAKTEILSHLRRGAPVAGIVRGAFLSVVQRVVEMAPLSDHVVLTGGVVAHNPTIREILSDKIGASVDVPSSPQFTGALGAALIAREQ
jgi:predicted CoA-substrate-specific enzyme activase